MKNQFKIVIFDGTFQTTTFIRRLMFGLAKKGHKVFVIGFNLKNTDPVPGVVYCSLGSNQNTLEFFKTSFQLQGFKIFKNLLNYRKKKIQEDNLKRLLKKISPDIVHVQWNSVLPWVVPFINANIYKIILSQRGYQTNIRPFSDKMNFEYLKNIYPKLSGLHSVSLEISTTGKKIGIPRNNIDKVVYTGLDFSKFPNLKSYHRPKELRLISIGRPHWIKDYKTAILACAILKQLNYKFHYTIIGAQGDEELIYLIHSYKLLSEVTLTDKMSQSSVFEKIKASSLTLISSIKEGIPNVAVESMALGTPVVSTNCGGINELISHQTEGWIVPIRNPQALANQIIEFSNLSTQEIINIRNEAREKVVEQFNENQMVDGMERLYNQVVNNKIH